MKVITDLFVIVIRESSLSVTIVSHIYYFFSFTHLELLYVNISFICLEGLRQILTFKDGSRTERSEKNI